MSAFIFHKNRLIHSFILSRNRWCSVVGSEKFIASAILLPSCNDQKVDRPKSVSPMYSKDPAT